jgi:hypothetical protein
MREAARALDDVSDHLGEVLRRADDLLAEWSRFGAQVRDQEATAIGEVVDGAVGRAASGGLDRAIGDRLRALTTELERLEQRARAASRAVVEQRETDRRLLWAVVAGVVLANALLVALILRRPEAPPVAEPIRIDAPPQVQPPSAAPAAPAAPDPVGAPVGVPAGSAATAASPGSAPGPAAAGALSGAKSGSAAPVKPPDAAPARPHKKLP